MKIKSAEFVKGIRGTDPLLKNANNTIAFVGRSNVGKSSLINSLSERKNLAKSSNKPGKTREINLYLLNDKYYLADLPGYGFAKIKAKKREKLGKLILWFLTSDEFKPKKVVLIIDSKTDLSQEDKLMIELLKDYRYKYLIVLNKEDRAKQSEKIVREKELLGLGEHCTWYSTKTGLGREKLLSRLDII